MFAKNKISQSMIDAVNQVVETAPIKEPTPTGMRVYGGSYGNSAKAKQDQTKKDIDNLKGPKAKEMKEAAKPDFLDMDKDGNKKESMKKALADKAMKEELKGNQDKIDANHNNKIDAQDFKILKAKKKVSEDMHFAKKLVEAEKAKSPAKNQDVADKSYLKDKPGSVKSDIKNLGRFLTGKKETNEEVESVEENYKQQDDAPITTDTLAGRLPGGKINSFKSYKLRVKPVDKEGDGSIKEPACDQPEKTAARASIHAEATIAGTPGWNKIEKNTKDKSGAIHTPMSRARDLAKSAFKRVQDKTKIKQ